MKVQRLVGTGRFELVEHDIPEPAPGEARVAIRAVGLCGSDRHYMHDTPYYSFDRIGEPLVLGHEPAGIVDAVGQGVHEVSVGDHVAVEPGVPCEQCEFCRSGRYNLCPHVRFLGYPGTDGALREYMCHPVEQLIRVPEDLPFTTVAALEPLTIALYATDLARVLPGQTAAIVGCGSIGLMLVSLLRTIGAVEIHAVDPLQHKLDHARSRGATGLWNGSRRADAAPLMEDTGGRGLDVVFEVAGHADAPGLAVEIAARGGVVALIGINDEDEIRYPASTARRKGLTILNVRRANLTFERAVRLVESGIIEVASLITHTYPLEETPRALDDFLAYRDGLVKACVEIPGPGAQP
jgi:L-iditol 2-dehydrogenase